MTALRMPKAVTDLLELPTTRLLISTSAGKDSTAMAKQVMAVHRRDRWRCEVIAVHQDLGRMEWAETLDLCHEQAAGLGIELVVQEHSKHDLLAGIQARAEKRPDAPPFPSSAARYCTAGWKRDPCSKWIRQTTPDGHAVVVAIGLRAGESANRARQPDHRIRSGANAPTKNRTVLDWHPILDFSEADVWKTLGTTPQAVLDTQIMVQEWRDAGLRGEALMEAVRALKRPYHPAYALGNTRLSCAMCVMGSARDIANGAEFRPDTYAALCAIEHKSGFSFQQNKSLAERVEIGRKNTQQQTLAL